MNLEDIYPDAQLGTSVPPASERHSQFQLLGLRIEEAEKRLHQVTGTVNQFADVCFGAQGSGANGVDPAEAPDGMLPKLLVSIDKLHGAISLLEDQADRLSQGI